MLAAELTGLVMIEASGGCGGDSSWCGFGTAILAFAASIAVTVLAAVGGALLGWSGQAAARATGADATTGGSRP